MKTQYSFDRLKRDILAGTTVGVIALPLAMALAIGCGVPPQHGLYTAIFSGIIIAITGGSRFNVSGPTAAFVVVLLPISQKYGLTGLLTATVFGGLILLVMGLSQLGGAIRLIPYPVIVGFTSGIGVVIGVFQVNHLLGIDLAPSSSVWGTLYQLSGLLSHWSWADTLVGVFTLMLLIYFPKLNFPIPSHLVAVLGGTTMSIWLGWLFAGIQPKTIGSEFGYIVNGELLHGIPSTLPSFAFPWAGVSSEAPLEWSLKLVKELGLAGFTIAVLGAIESLLCAVVADGMTGTKHNPNRELIGQGLGNLIAPFFGAIPATAAIARTAANIKAGATSSVSALVHGLFLLATLVFLGQWLSFIPMSSLAALLLLIAWNIAEANYFIKIVRTAPKSDVMVMVTCFLLTVFVDMVMAVTVGIGLASFLFIKRMSELSGIPPLDTESVEACQFREQNTLLFRLQGPLFFGAAQKALSHLELIEPNRHSVILDFSMVPLMDLTGLVALESIIDRLFMNQVPVVFLCVAPKLKKKLSVAYGEDKYRQIFFAEDYQGSMLALKQPPAVRIN